MRHPYPDPTPWPKSESQLFDYGQRIRAAKGTNLPFITGWRWTLVQKSLGHGIQDPLPVDMDVSSLVTLLSNSGLSNCTALGDI